MKGSAEELLAKLQDMSPETHLSILEEFVTGSIHQDYINELCARIQQIKDCYLGVLTPDGDNYNRGGIQALEDAKHVFDDMVANLKTDLSYEETDNADDE